jgi:hypothetical protein
MSRLTDERISAVTSELFLNEYFEGEISESAQAE